MITQMKKQAFMVFHRDYQNFVTKLGQLGVLHVVERENPEKGDSLSEQEARIARIERILAILTGARAKAEPSLEEINRQVERDPDAESLMNEVEEAGNRLGRIRDSIDETRSMIERQEPWGEYTEKDLWSD